MKVVFTTKGNDKESVMDLRFGRCAYFAVYDTDSKSMAFIENKGVDQSQGAGINAAQTVVNQGVEAVVTGRLGPKAKQVLDAAGIDGYVSDEITLDKALVMFENEDLHKMNR